MSEKRSGCKSCLIWFLCVFGFFALIVGITAYIGYRKFVSFRDQYTGSKPLAMPSLNYTPAEYSGTTNRIQGFLQGAAAGRSNVQLALSARDLNMLIASSEFSNRVHLTLSNEAIVGQFSVPLENIGIRFLRGRYLNGAGALAVSCENGRLNVNLKDLTVNGMALPENYMSAIRQQNFAEGFATNENAQASLERVKRIAVEKDRLIFEVGSTNVVVEAP